MRTDVMDTGVYLMRNENMTTHTRDGFGMWMSLYAGIMFLFLFSSYVVIGTISCSAKWESSGFTTSFGPIKGCLIQLDDGRWIPSENYREL
jgi:hypothetical protein